MSETKKSTKKDKSSKKKKDSNGETKKSKSKLPSEEKIDPQTSDVDFEAGMIFNKFDKDSQAIISPDKFRQLWRVVKGVEDSGTKVLPQDKSTSPSSTEPIISNSTSEEKKSDLPIEYISGRLMTHYDETAGVAIPLSAVESHCNIGNTVIPLTDAYRIRYEKLRHQMTSRLLPRREQLLQIRRQLESTSEEMTCNVRIIEKETLLDAEKIIERLKNSESLRQSLIKQQLIELEGELENIERVIYKIESVNARSSTLNNTPNDIIMTSVTSAASSSSSSSSSANNVTMMKGDNMTISAKSLLHDMINNTKMTENITNSNIMSTSPPTTTIEQIRGPKAMAMVDLIQQYHELSSIMDRLSTKTSSSLSNSIQLDIPLTTFPKEIAERLDKISKYDAMNHALEVKDQMIWTLLQERKEQQEVLIQEKQLSTQYAAELTDWVSMMQIMRNDMDKMTRQLHTVQRENHELIEILQDHHIIYMRNNDDNNSNNNNSGSAMEERNIDGSDDMNDNKWESETMNNENIRIQKRNIPPPNSMKKSPNNVNKSSYINSQVYDNSYSPQVVQLSRDHNTNDIDENDNNDEEYEEE